MGHTSNMDQRDTRRLLIVGAVAVVRLAARKGAPEGSWLGRMMARKPKTLVAVISVAMAAPVLPSKIRENSETDRPVRGDFGRVTRWIRRERLDRKSW